MAMAEVIEASAVLASDRCAAPAFRLRDWATTGPVFVAGGLVSDKYRLAPVSSFDRSVASLEDGAYEVASLKASPVRVGDAPDMARIAREALTDSTAQLAPVQIHGRQVLLEQPGDVEPVALFESMWGTGEPVALNSAFVTGLLEGSELDQDQPLPPFFGRTPWIVRHKLYMCAEQPKTGRREHRPVVVERVAYGSSTHVREGRKTHVAGRWQAIIMPVRLGK